MVCGWSRRDKRWFRRTQTSHCVGGRVVHSSVCETWILIDSRAWSWVNVCDTHTVRQSHRRKKNIRLRVQKATGRRSSILTLTPRGSAIAEEPRDALRQLKYYGRFLTELLTRSSTNPEEPCLSLIHISEPTRPY